MPDEPSASGVRAARCGGGTTESHQTPEARLAVAVGYHGGRSRGRREEAGVSRQGIYLHFPFRAELLAALHLCMFDTDVAPVLLRHSMTGAMTA